MAMAAMGGGNGGRCGDSGENCLRRLGEGNLMLQHAMADRGFFYCLCALFGVRGESWLRVFYCLCALLLVCIAR